MSLFSHKSAKVSKLIIEVAPDSVGGLYLVTDTQVLPKVLYAKRLPIVVHEGEPQEDALARVFALLGNALVREGAPLVREETGEGSPQVVSVAFNAPWEATSLHMGKIERPKAFTITHSLIADSVAAMPSIPSDKLLVEREVIGTILNGYEVRNPYGKRANRATLITLESLVSTDILRFVDDLLAKLYHLEASRIKHIAALNAHYEGLRMLFPLERTFIMIDATSPTTRFLLERNGLLVAVTEQTRARGIVSVEEVIAGCQELAQSFPLPRSIFIVTREDADVLKESLSRADFGTLWLSDERPAIMPLKMSHFKDHLVQATDTVDVPLLLLALFYSA